MMRWILERLSRLFRERIIGARADGKPYLSRFYIFGGPRTWSSIGQNEGESYGWSWLPFNIMLHKFHMSDDDSALHNHPWKWSYSLILAGGYVEERRINNYTNVHSTFLTWRVFRPWQWNSIKADDFHRVDLIEKDCWTLFIAGPKSQSWKFWDRKTGEYVPWREFI